MILRDSPLAENERAVEVAGDNQLKLVARELPPSLNPTILAVDWGHRESARPRMWSLLMRIPDKSHCPRNSQGVAAQAALSPAETLLASRKSCE